MRGSINLIPKRTSPNLPQLIILLITIVIPDTLRRSTDNLRKLLIRGNAVQKAEVANEYTLELSGVCIARVGVAGFTDDVVFVGQNVNGGFGDVGGGFEVFLALFWGCAGKFDEGA